MQRQKNTQGLKNNAEEAPARKNLQIVCRHVKGIDQLTDKENSLSAHQNETRI